MKKKRVHIVICEYDPPFKDGRVSRIKALSKYLSENNFDVNIYSMGEKTDVVKNNYALLYQIKYPGMGLVSENNNGKNNNSLIIHYIKVLTRYIFPDRYIFGLPAMIKVIGSNINKDENIIISVPWFSCLLVLLSRVFLRKSINIVIDYRDLWSNNLIFINNITRFIARFVEKKVLRNVRAVLVTTKPAATYMKKLCDDVIVVRNGISIHDLSIIEELSNKKQKSNIKKQPFMISYFGNLGNKRVCVEFLKVLQEGGNDLQLYGSVDRRHRVSLPGAYMGFLDKKSMYETIIKSDFVMVVILKEENDLYAIPGKVYEMIATGTPIILYTTDSSLTLEYLREIDYPFIYFNVDKSYSILETNQSLCEFVNNKNNVNKLWLKKNTVIREKEYNSILSILK